MTDNVDRFNDAIYTVRDALKTAEQLKRRILGEDAPDEKEDVISIASLSLMLEQGPEAIQNITKEIINCLAQIELLLFEQSLNHVEPEAKKSQFEKASTPIRNAGIQNQNASIPA